MMICFDIATRFHYTGDFRFSPVTISNKEPLRPGKTKWDRETIWNQNTEQYLKKSSIGDDTGYSFKDFWSNCCVLLGDIAKMDGIQQICHQYYLQNGVINAKNAVIRIKKFLAI